MRRIVGAFSGLVGLLLVASPAAASLLTAGDVDDNLNFEYYLGYLDNRGDGTLPSLSLNDRVTLRFINPEGQPADDVYVTITAEGQATPLLAAESGPDGVLRFFPVYDGMGSSQRFTVEVRGESTHEMIGAWTFDLSDLVGNREIAITLDLPAAREPNSLDLLLVVDTTGSMSDELYYLTTEFESIVSAIKGGHSTVDVRFGLIVYRDEGDLYVVRSYGFTSSVEEMQGWLSLQQAGGGGDYPEAVHEALAAAMQEAWRPEAMRLLFHVADAPPHAEFYGATMAVIRQARQQGIRIHPLAASGVAAAAEYLMRAAAVLTEGRYLFLTDDSGVGNPHTEPTVQCYLVTSLGNLIVRVVDANLLGRRVEPAPEDVIRTVGSYAAGLCLEDEANTTGGVGGGTMSSSPPGSPDGVTFATVEYGEVVLDDGLTDATGTAGTSVPYSESGSHETGRYDFHGAESASLSYSPSPSWSWLAVALLLGLIVVQQVLRHVLGLPDSNLTKVTEERAKRL